MSGLQFKQNDHYIELLKDFSYLQKNNPKHPDISIMKKELTGIELAMPTNDILQNTKIAFPAQAEL